MDAKYVFRLFVTGRTPASEQAVRNLQHICAEHLSGKAELYIVDVLEQPEEAETRRVMATPTLLRESPPPIRRIIGDLSDRPRVLECLDIEPAIPPTSHRRTNGQE
jgi:circadian clock protein KaiB